MLHKLQVALTELKESIFETVKYLFSEPRISIPCRFKDWLCLRLRDRIWNIDWRRNIALFVASVFLVRFILTDERIDKSVQVMSAIPSLLKFGDIPHIILFCIIIIVLFLFVQSFFKIKGMRFFLISFSGLFIAKSWDNVNKHIDKNNFIDKTFQQFSRPLDWNILLTFSNFFQLAAVILIGILFYLFFRLLSRSSGIDITPFENTNSDPKDALKSGKAISDLLAAELHRIYHLHNFIEDGKLQLLQTSSSMLRFCREDLNLCSFKGESLEKSLSQTGSLPIANSAVLPVGGILLAIKELWPTGSSQLITGSINNHDSKLQLLARYEETSRRSNTPAYTHAYKVDQEEIIESRNLVHEMVQALACRVALDLSSTSLSTSHWQAFQSLTEALSHFYRHERTDNLNELNRSFDWCKKAIEYDKCYDKVGDLLSLIGFSYLNKDEYELAEEALLNAMEVNPRSPYVHSTLGNKYYLLCEYEEAIYHYEYAQQLNPNRSATYLRLGCVYLIAPPHLKDFSKARKYFWHSLSLDPNSNAAQSLLSWLDFLCHLEENREGQYEQAQINLDKAINRLTKISRRKLSYIDYSNLAIFFLYKGNEKRAYQNWWKALQLCPKILDSPKGNNISSFDKLHYIFYKLLTSKTSKEINNEIERLKQTLNNKLPPYKRIIEDLLWDARIVLWKCSEVIKTDGESEKLVFSIHDNQLNLQVIEDSSRSENYKILEISMTKFVEELNLYYLTHFAQVNDG